ncbi:MAG: LppX_LprAFG lipoprotein [Thermoleophilia bacterium]
MPNASATRAAPTTTIFAGRIGPASRTFRHRAGLARWLAAAAMAALAPVAFLLGGCAGGDKSVDPVTVFADSAVAMKALQSFHFTYQVTKPADAPPATGLEIARIVGDVTTEGNMQATIDVLQNGIPLTVAFVAVGPTHYVQDPNTQKWQSMPAAFSPVGSLNLNTGTIQVLERIANPSYVGKEDVSGSPAYHLQGEVAAADVAAIAGSTTTDKPFAGDVWVGVDDHLVRRIVITGAATANEVEGTTRTIDLSDFDKPVDIVPPQ